MDKEQKKVIKIAIIVVLSLIILEIIIIKINIFLKKEEFSIPEVEKNTIEGSPKNISKECMYQEVKVNDDYVVHLCAIPTYKDNKLTIYFTSSKVNKGLVKFKVLDLKNNVIGESGLISSNSYIKDISLNKELSDKEKITIKVMHYEKDTYYSLGGIKLDLQVRSL